MVFFAIDQLPVNLWRNGAGETREICCVPSGTWDFDWRASIASVARSSEFSLFAGVDRNITLLEGPEVMLDAGAAFCHTLTCHQPFAFAGEQPITAHLPQGATAMDFNIMTRRDRCYSRVRVVESSFTTTAGAAGVLLVLNGAWQLGEHPLNAREGVSWQEGEQSVRLLGAKGQLLLAEIFFLPITPIG